jgi:1,4-dihydroxy-2-naphthoate octaprenyltransferase
MRSLVLFIRLSRPLFIIGTAFVYAFGVGIAHYLGLSVNWSVYLLGQFWVTTLQLSTHYLNEYYNAPADQNNPNRTLLTGGSGALGPGKLSRQVALTAGLTCLAFLASFTVLIISRVQPEPVLYLIMLLAFLGAFFYSVPPISLEGSGYGELSTSFLVAFLLPSFSFVLQTGEMHRFVAMSAFPLTMIHLAMMIAFELPDYASDDKFNKRTLLIRLGWRNGMNFHNMLIIGGYLLLLIELIFGFPRVVVMHALLSLPIALIQIWQIYRIESGGKPNWTGVTVNALGTFGALVYFMGFAYWTNSL